ncbi:MAG: phosphate ABC transporter permease PstA [Xanthomonadaceae bacterium]|nr:phosphate ABC transporter permease PstA [Xanthomonadaceae bacterium]
MNASATSALERRPSLRYRRRYLTNLLGWTFYGVFFAVLAFALLDIIAVVLKHGIPAISLELFTKPTNGVSGGLLNAIIGTFLLTFGSLLLAAPVGILGGIYVAEYTASPFARAARYLSDVLVGVPSIVFGLFGYLAMVTWLGWHFSLLAGCITLALMIIPYILRTTELAFRGVVSELREAAYALGASHAKVTLKVILRACRGRVLTGVLLAMAISMGETAPLIYTVNWSNYVWGGHLTHEPVGYLTYVVWSFINEPFDSAHALAYAAALLVTVFVLVITTSTRLLLSRLDTHKPH